MSLPGIKNNSAKVLVLAILALTATTIPHAFAVQREVGPGQTHTTIGACITAASAGDICNVHEATYTQTVTINKDITVQANTGDTPTIDLAAGGIGVIISASGATFSGIEVKNYGSASSGQAGIFINSGVTRVTISGAIVSGGYGTGIYARGSNGPLLIENCQVYGALQQTSGSGLNGDGIVLLFSTSSDNTFPNGEIIRNCAVHDNQIDGTKASGSYVTIEDSNIYSNVSTLGAHSDGLQMLGNGQWDHLRLINNIFRNHTQNIFLECRTDLPCEDIEIYGNKIYNDRGVVNGQNMDVQVPAGFSGLIFPQPAECKDAKVYNNTFGRHSGIAVLWTSCSTGTNEFKNNIIQNDFGNGMLAGGTLGCPEWASGTMDYNHWDMPNPPRYVIACSASGFHRTLAQFQAASTGLERHGSSGAASSASENFGSVRAPGLPLPAPYNRDATGNIRGADGVWDRGAFEFVVPSRPNPPQNLGPAAP